MKKTCAQCQQGFEITQDDLQFYDKVSPVIEGQKFSIPPPTFCPDCRAQRRMAWRNERTLYARTCDLCKKKVISMYAPATPYLVYCSTCWYGDNWNPFVFGQPINFDEPFFDQWKRLIEHVPLCATYQTGQNENSEYINFAGMNKNCYLLFNSGTNENCYYGRGAWDCLNCVDTLFGSHNELCYECVNSHHCYSTSFSINSYQCSNSYFLANCIGCDHCFGCVNLRHKEYYFFNEPLSKQEYEARIKEFLSSYSGLQKARRRFSQLLKGAIHRENQNINAENSTGDYLTNSHNCRQCFEMIEAEDCAYSDSMKNCHDVSDGLGYGVQSELMYEVVGTGRGQHMVSTCVCSYSSNLLYSAFCHHSQQCFGSVGLQHQRYCILNVPYSAEEYANLSAKLITHMSQTGEWGEFLPARFSPFGYNETIANDYFPLSRDQALAQGFQWSDYESPTPQVTQTINASNLPDIIHEVTEEITNNAVKCEVTDKPFRIIKPELEFYRQLGLPLPRRHPDQRHRDRVALRNPRKLWTRNCAKCRNSIMTSYSPDRPEIVYCEACYLKEVY